MALYHGGAQEFIANCEAEVEPAGFLLAPLGDQQGTACSFGSRHAQDRPDEIEYSQFLAFAPREVFTWLALLTRQSSQAAQTIFVAKRSL